MSPLTSHANGPNGESPFRDDALAGRMARAVPLGALATCLVFSFMILNQRSETPPAPLVITLREFTPVRPEAEFVSKKPPAPRKPVPKKVLPKKTIKRKPVAAKAPLALAKRPPNPTVLASPMVKDTEEPEEIPPPAPTYDFTQLDGLPRLLSQVDPEYPLAARSAGIEGRIVLKALVEPDGTVSQTMVVKSMAEAGFDASAIEAVRQWRFSAPLLKGQPVRVWMIIPIHFKLYD